MKNIAKFLLDLFILLLIELCAEITYKITLAADQQLQHANKCILVKNKDMQCLYGDQIRSLQLSCSILGTSIRNRK